MVVMTVCGGALVPALLLRSGEDLGTVFRLWLVLTALAIPFAELGSWRLVAVLTGLHRLATSRAHRPVSAPPLEPPTTGELRAI